MRNLVLSSLLLVLVGFAAIVNAAGSFTAGLIPVDNNGSQIFYWYCPPTTTNRTAAAHAPTILWLQGGPGASGLVGALYEMGPYKLEVKANSSSSAAGGGILRGGSVNASAYILVDREVGAWTNQYGMLFVDSPVGTGYSVAASPAAYSQTEEQVADNLYRLLQGFYARYPQLLDRGLYIMGESYGGHYVPAFAYYLLQKNDAIPPTPAPTPSPTTPPPTMAPSQPSSSSSSSSSRLRGSMAAAEGEPVRILLKGIGIGDGLTDPALQVMSKARVAYDMGLLNGKDFLQARGLALRASLAALDGDYATAREYREQVEAYIESLSGINLYDVRTFQGYEFIDQAIANWAADPMTKARFNLPQNASWKNADQYAAAAGDALKNDLMMSYAPQVAAILDKYKLPVLLYQGQFDLKDGPVSNQAWIRSLRWSGQKGYLNASREQWWADVPSPGSGVNKDTTTPAAATTTRAPAGWVQRYGLLTECVIAGAGHLAPMDQPARALDMVLRFIEGKEWGPDENKEEGLVIAIE